MEFYNFLTYNDASKKLIITIHNRNCYNGMFYAVLFRIDQTQQYLQL